MIYKGSLGFRGDCFQSNRQERKERKEKPKLGLLGAFCNSKPREIPESRPLERLGHGLVEVIDEIQDTLFQFLK